MAMALALRTLTARRATLAAPGRQQQQRRAASSGGSSGAKDVGILAMDVYFPSTYVAQKDLEEHDGIAAGKYTLGLGQNNMAFCGDREDIASICMTAVRSLMDKYRVSPETVGRLEVGTETIIDKSKSVKSTLMQLFADSGNTDLEGIDTTNACYGGTNALFNSLNWIESSAWDGRNAIVVAGDIAVYEAGNARPTGGAGAVAMLIGPNAPVVIERGTRATYMADVYDFYKPRLESEYPLVDGKLSQECYLQAVDRCYQLYAKKCDKVSGGKKPFSLDDIQYAVYHSPYTKLVQKSYARMLYNDFVRGGTGAGLSGAGAEALEPFRSLAPESTYAHRELEAAFVKASKQAYDAKVGPSLLLPKELGNLYTGSLYAGLLSLLTEVPDAKLVGSRSMLFSYGSGLAATLFGMNVVRSVDHIRQAVQLRPRLQARTKASPQEFNSALLRREHKHSGSNYHPEDPVDKLAPGTYYLDHVDRMYRRAYKRVPL